MSFWIRKALLALIILPLAAPTLAEDSTAEPEVQIRYGEKETHYEYRVNGELVQIKVVPKVGPEYYLVPSDTGEWVQSEKPRILVPSWKLLEW
ncbi:conserved hypothetical protein [Hahella chejuensis KCTC 2396]|uniref:DUF2782 domain-containing protein n=1 Tax=Hahella chejuensis (strain KCTC 2396) TaxID=349521 RepID=Q2S8M9_HAHCH|nr:DUF2782 domain-containing protein [Hahella chejuensis]ABC32995.1 conserved hypothetical protein [Hahella chejuensis KCTC 2396]